MSELASQEISQGTRKCMKMNLIIITNHLDHYDANTKFYWQCQIFWMVTEKIVCFPDQWCSIICGTIVWSSRSENYRCEWHSVKEIRGKQIFFFAFLAAPDWFQQWKKPTLTHYKGHLIWDGGRLWNLLKTRKNWLFWRSLLSPYPGYLDTGTNLIIQALQIMP